MAGGGEASGSFTGPLSVGLYDHPSEEAACIWGWCLVPLSLWHECPVLITAWELENHWDLRSQVLSFAAPLKWPSLILVMAALLVCPHLSHSLEWTLSTGLCGSDLPSLLAGILAPGCAWLLQPHCEARAVS